jgi:hypothetical protein
MFIITQGNVTFDLYGVVNFLILIMFWILVSFKQRILKHVDRLGYAITYQKYMFKQQVLKGYMIIKFP